MWHQRLAAAHRMLSARRSPQVTAVALACGFNDVSHFSKAFKAAFGRAPRLLKRD